MSHNINLNVEIAFLDTSLHVKADKIPNPGLKDLLELYQKGEFEDILNLNPWLKTAGKDILETVTNILSNEGETNLAQMFYLGVAALHVFIQKNWLGIQTPSDSDYDYLLSAAESRKALVLDGECFFPTVKGLPFLHIAKTILLDLQDKFKSFQLADWWLLRYIYVHQRVLEEPSQQLNAALLQIVDQKLNGMLECLENETELATILQLEIGYGFLLYGEIQKTKTHFERASQLSNFKIEWTGALGKRTRYQQTALPQLTIRLHHETKIANNGSTISTNFPRDMKLDDDTRLNQILFVDIADNIVPELDLIHQALLIAQATQLEKFKPRDDLLAEELAPVLNCIIGQPRVWCFHITALLIRSQMESNQSRAVERSMMQLQELADCFAKQAPEIGQRMQYFFVSRMPLEFEVLKSLAEVQTSLGAINSALDIYLRLQAWDGVISCYQILEMKHKAEEIVRQELAKEETPKLWCLLGNCTDDVTCYEKAWEISKHTSARAQRDWGFFYYSKKQFRECIPHFQESLKVNSLQEGIWIRLAFCALEIEDWETAASAYRRYCMLNSECFEAWNNVAKCYVKLGQKSRAWKALQEAVKCNFENWKVWDNLMVVSVDCCEYEEVIRAYNRILDLKEKHVDAEVLKILVQAIAENKEDNYGEKVGRLATSIHKLLGRITSQVTNHAGVWEAYADLVQSEGDTFRVAQFLQKAYRSAVQEKNWEKDVESCLKTLKLSCKFIESCLALLAKDCSKDNQQLAISAKLSLRSTISQVKRCYEFDVPESISAQLDLMEKLQTDLTASLSPQI